MVNYNILNDSMVLSFNGKLVTIAKDDPRFDPILECIRTGRRDDIPAIADIEAGFHFDGIELRDGLLWEGETPLPSELSDKILKFKDLKLPFDGLFAFWENLKKNPSYNSRQALFKFLEHNGHTLTEDGCFIAYRGVTEEFKDKHTNSFDNKPGSVCEMARDLVDDNPNNTCSAGLHVACFDYAKGFGPKTVEVKVNPADVVCVPVDYNGTKMRTCKFEVLRECEKMRTDILEGHEVQDDHGSCDVDSDGGEPEESDDDRRERLLDEGICPACEVSVDTLDQNFCPNCGEDLN